MKSPLYFDSQAAQRILLPAGNAGLWYTRFFNEYDESWSLGKNSKTKWIKDAAGERSHAELVDLLRSYADRRFELVGKQGALRELTTSWHFVTGLGLDHPVENGFAWHPTLGTPYLPGSGVKGLLGAWLYAQAQDEDRSQDDRGEARRRHEHWCGKAETPGGDEDPGHAGSLIFFDALPSGAPTLAADVMTPHMGQWYADGDEIEDAATEPEKVPADWHSPIPVPFLVVKDTCFHFAAMPRPGAWWDGRDPQEEAALALDELAEALTVLGAGAKTAAGYGRFQSGRGYLDKKLIEDAERRKKERREKRTMAEIEPHFGTFTKSVRKVLGNNETSGLTSHVLNAMSAGEAERGWSRDECVQLARSLERWMKSRNKWVDDAQEDPREERRSSSLRQTLAVMHWQKHGRPR